jgi:hypothetical protein
VNHLYSDKCAALASPGSNRLSVGTCESCHGPISPDEIAAKTEVDTITLFLNHHGVASGAREVPGIEYLLDLYRW